MNLEDDDDDTEQVDEHLAHADQIIEGRLAGKTKTQYANKLKHIVERLKVTNPEVLGADGHIIADSLNATNLKQLFGYLALKHDKNKQALEPNVYQSFQHVSGYKSALKFYLKTRGITLSGPVNLVLMDFFGGLKRKLANKKQQGEMSLSEGKQPLSFAGYKFLARKATTATEDFHVAIFAWLFLVLCWNLMARCISVSGLMYCHISWANDSLTVVFPTHKGDQEGKTALPKHVFCNRECPEICPILALSVFVFTQGFRRQGSKALLFSETESAESRFSKWLKAACGRHFVDLVALGLIIVEIGTHSFRKGKHKVLA